MNVIDLESEQNRNLGKILQLQARDNGETEFLITDDQRITFAQAEEMTNRLAAGFTELGVEKGDRVTFFMGNFSELVLMCIALNKLGAVWVPICTDYRGEWLQDALVRSRSKILVSDSAQVTHLSKIISQLNHEHLVVLEDEAAATHGGIAYSSLCEHDPLKVDYTAISYGDTCAILWTSGTTGKSKGVMVAHNNFIRATALGTLLQYNTQPGDIVYCAMPLYHAGAWITSVIRALVSGVGLVIEKKFSVSAFMDRIKHFNATQTFAVGAMGNFLLSKPESDDDADNPLREAMIVPMTPSTWSKFEGRFGVHLIRSGLGQSECLLVLNHEHSDVEVPLHALGFPTPGADVQLFDDNGFEVGNGETGEIWVSHSVPYAIYNGYFDDPQATAETIRSGWFLTGDMGRKDPDTGAFYFVDRKKDAVRFAGRNISTLEVEGVVLRHPEVAQAAAFGIPIPELTSEDELKLNVVRKEGSDLGAEELCKFINDNAPYFFVPRYLEFVDSLPYTPTEKVQKYKLREAGLNETTWDLKKSNYKVLR
jgi:crotonobetaine/carnitine-CoA ligase